MLDLSIKIKTLPEVQTNILKFLSDHRYPAPHMPTFNKIMNGSMVAHEKINSILELNEENGYRAIITMFQIFR